MAEARAIPFFRLYGDSASPPDPVPHFLHVERIAVRARLHRWRIRPHRHRGLFQAFLITTGSGEVDIEGERRRFAAPWLIWMPPGVVHGFAFTPGSDGYVITIADDLLAAIWQDQAEGLLQPAAERPFTTALPAAAAIGLDLATSFRAIAREASFAWRGARLVIEAHLRLILAGLLRLIGHRQEGDNGLSPGHAALYRRFRQLVEDRLRERWSIERYAEALGVTADRLHDVCSRAAGRAPKALIQERLLMEAKRHLLYTTMSIAEIGYDLGFADAAYFSRFFARRAGLSPAAFRRAWARR